MTAFRERSFDMVLSEAILDEYLRVLALPKFGYSSAAISVFLKELRSLGHLVEPRRRLRVVRDDPDDDKFLECGLEGLAQVLVTGDNHLLEIGVFRKIRIITPAEFLKKLADEGYPAGPDSDPTLAAEPRASIKNYSPPRPGRRGKRRRRAG